MSREIEEMVKFMLEKSNSANVEPIFTAKDGTQIVLGEQLTKILDDILEQAFIPFLAECLYNADYRKSTNVAREIFAEIDRIRMVEKVVRNRGVEGCYNLDSEYAELRKKYESERAE